MKIKKTTPLLFFLLFSIFFSFEKTAAQNSVKKKNASMENEKYLIGFDEKAIIEELKQRGVPEKNFAEIIHSRRHLYVAAQKESKKPNPYFPTNDPQLRSASGCPNADFEDYTFTNWTGGTGDCSGYPLPTPWVPGLIIGPLNTVESDGYSQHTLLDHPAAYDFNAGFTGGIPNLRYRAPGSGNVSVRLGNSHMYWGTEYLKYSLPVTATNNTYSYQYAIVLEDPPGHLPSEQPRFSVNVYDGSGIAIPGPCMSYSIDGEAASADTSFKPFYDPYFGNHLGYYKKWSTMIVDLSAYIGQTVTIEFITQDCTLGGHFGYAYIDATCLQMQSTLPFCQNDTVGTLTAPVGYNAYQWFDSFGNPIAGANGTTLTITNPVNGTTYSVAMYSGSGCSHSLTTTIVIDSNSVLFSNIVSNPICYEDNVGYAYIEQSGGGGPFIYTWTDILGNIITPSGSTDSLLNVPGGEYVVTVEAANGCISSDTFLITQPPPIFAYSGIPICPLETSVTLTSPTGSNFQWYDPTGSLIPGATASTYAAPTPAIGQAYSVNYTPPSGCDITNVNSFYLYELNQAPAGVSNATCFGYNNGSAFTTPPTSYPLGAAGPFTYSWSSAGSSSVIGIYDSLNNIFAGTYYVTTTSAAGCTISDTIVVTELPNTFDSLKITMKYCPEDDPITLYAPPGYSSYAWYANQNATGPVLSTFDSLVVSPPIFGAPYTVFMPNPIVGDCNIILKVNLDYSAPPPIPGFITSTNVFTPNGDGENDQFLLNENSYRYIKDLHIQVFNRWGTKVFEADELSDRWDGKINGNDAAEGVYYWMASYTQACLIDPPTLTAYGFVQILR